MDRQGSQSDRAAADNARLAKIAVPASAEEDLAWKW